MKNPLGDIAKRMILQKGFKFSSNKIQIPKFSSD